MRKINAGYLLISIAFLIISGCHNEKDPATSGITGSVTDHSDCKLFQASNLKFTEPDTFSCINYTYDWVNSKLSIQHVNAAFNCCPKEIYCKIFTHNDTIVIQELEKEQACNCLCLFDLNVEVNNVDQPKYVLKFIEPYAEGQKELIFSIDLTSGNVGEYCVDRHGYPWGE
jgi:hypothetical protein